MNCLRRTYDWVLGWAKTPYGAIALFLLAFSESSIFPIAPDVLLIVLVLGAKNKAFGYATNCTVGSILGAFWGYGIGYFLWWDADKSFSPLAMFFFEQIPGFTQNVFFEIKTLFEKWDFWIIFTAGFTPIPYKLFTVSGGAFQIDLTMFTLASVIGRGARFFLLAFLLWKFGETIKLFIEKYFNMIAIGISLIFIGVFVALKSTLFF
jgi:membrane protein YqaA with SNARE-associated domain